MLILKFCANLHFSFFNLKFPDVGYGRFPPKIISEVWLTIISMLVGATFYALFIGHMSSLMLKVDSAGRLYHEKLSQVNEYMKARKIPLETRHKVRAYYEYRWPQQKYFDEHSIMTALTPSLQFEVRSELCHELIQSVPFFQNADPLFIECVVTKLRFCVAMVGDTLINKGKIGDTMYFIQRGLVEVLDSEGQKTTNLSGTDQAHLMNKYSAAIIKSSSQYFSF